MIALPYFSFRRLFFSAVFCSLFLAFAALKAQAQTPALGVRFLAPDLAYQLDEGVRTTSLSKGAFVVVQVTPGGPAAMAGIHPGDVLISIAGKRVCQGDDVSTSINSAGVGTDLPIVFVRDGEIKELKVRTANRTDFDPDASREAEAVVRIAADWQRNDDKAVLSDCRVIPEAKQALAHFACGLSEFRRRRAKQAEKIFKLSQGLCPGCPDLFANEAFGLRISGWDYVAPWSTATTLMNRYGTAEKMAFTALDTRLQTDMKMLAEKGQTQAALDRYIAYANGESSCRNVPPPPELANLVIQLVTKVNPSLAVPQSARRKADQARTTAKIANSAAQLVQAEEQWNAVMWLAPWWGEPYAKAADLLERTGHPNEAVEIAKRALSLPRVDAPEAEPATPESAPGGGQFSGNPADVLRQCIGALATTQQGSPEEQQLLKQAIQAASKMTSAPTVPDTAQRYLARGQAALEMAQSPSDYADAVTEFENAVRTAPWWADAYRGMGLAQEKATNYKDSIAAYHLYLAAAPGAADAKDVQNKIYKLEYALDRSQKQSVEKALAEKELAARIQGLEGLWQEEGTGHMWRASIQDGMFVARKPGYVDKENSYNGEFLIRAVFKANGLEGTYQVPPMTETKSSCSTGQSEQPLSATVSNGGRTITLKYQSPVYSSKYVRATLFTVAKCISFDKMRDDVKIVVLQKQ